MTPRPEIPFRLGSREHPPWIPFRLGSREHPPVRRLRFAIQGLIEMEVASYKSARTCSRSCWTRSPTRNQLAEIPLFGTGAAGNIRATARAGRL